MKNKIKETKKSKKAEKKVKRSDLGKASGGRWVGQLGGSGGFFGREFK